MQTEKTNIETIKFSELSVPEPVLHALQDMNFVDCTEIQSLSLPIIINGQDVAGQAQTGTGKTAAFLIGLYTHLSQHPQEKSKNRQLRALILAPTRELAIQIYNDACEIGKYSNLDIAVAYGGTDYEKQRKKIASGCDVLIGTPGRLIDFFKQRIFNLKGVQSVVLDEADRMFDLGFINDIRYLLRRMPPPSERLSMLFSATLSHRVMELAYEHMDNPVSVKTSRETVTAEGVNQTLYHPSSEEKIPLLLGLLKQFSPEKCMIFVNTRRTAERVESYLKGNDYPCALLSGDVRQNKRQRLLKAFTDGELPIMIATDVAARGLHIEDVTHVINYDLPQNAQDYVHRIGRTARAGNKGEAISFACEEYAISLMDIEEFIDKSIPTISICDDILITPKPPIKQHRDRVTSGKKPSGYRNRGRRNPKNQQSNRKH